MVNNIVHMFNQKLYSILFQSYRRCLRSTQRTPQRHVLNAIHVNHRSPYRHDSQTHAHALLLLGIRFQFRFQFKFDFIRVCVAMM